MNRSLRRAQPRNPLPFINDCGLLAVSDELVEYFVQNKQVKFIKGDLQRKAGRARKTSGKACNANMQVWFCG